MRNVESNPLIARIKNRKVIQCTFAPLFTANEQLQAGP